MPTLLLSTMALPGAAALAEAARRAGWQARAHDQSLKLRPGKEVVFYGGSDLALGIATQFRLALLEPSLDLLAKTPLEYRFRAVEYGTFSDLQNLKSPTFVKPADPLNKAFEAGIYADARAIRTPTKVLSATPILAAEPVDWLFEYRCFVLEGKVVATSPYLQFGRPIWRPFAQGGTARQESAAVRAFCERFLTRVKDLLPPAFVVDVGLIEDRGWAVVEFNPAWCAGLLGADPQPILDVLRRASRDRASLSEGDRRWVIERKTRRDA
jgi:hypothetical protein